MLKQKNLRVLIISFFLLLLISCSKVENKAILKGEISGQIDFPLLATYDKYTDVPDTIPVKNGKFEFTFPLTFPTSLVLKLGTAQKSLYLEPGKTLTVKCDSSLSSSGFTYSGELINENIIHDSVKHWLSMIERPFMSTIPKQMAIKHYDSTFNLINEFTLNEIAKRNTTPLFKEFIQSLISINSQYQKLLYGRFKTKNDTSFFDFIDLAQLNNPKLLNIPTQKYVVALYLDIFTLNRLWKADSIQKKDSLLVLKIVSNIIKEKFSKELQDYLYFLNTLKYFNIRYTISSYISDQIEFNYNYEVFSRNNQDPEYLRRFNLAYAKKLLLSKGKKAPDFSTVDSSGNTVSLNQFKGKYLYLDFWATWCSPCIEELPYLAKLDSLYKGKNIAFVSLSLEDEKENWKSFISKKSLIGTQLISNQGWNSKVAQDYQISGVPTYFLIDPDGNFIYANAPRPSSPEIRKMLDTLLSSSQ